MNSNSRLRWSATFLAILGVVFFSYSQGFNGSFQFDDEPNLGWLTHANSLSEAWLFIFSGNAGPLGRPVALASFYFLNAPHWPHDPAGFFYTNTLIHLLNGVLIAWLFFLIGPGKRHLNHHWYALSVAAIWLLLPILASTNLMAVQRMTSLSATFVLAGLIAYVKCRMLLAEKPRFAITTMSASLALFTLMAAYSKENGILLPAYVLVLEYTLLSANGFPTSHTFRRWRTIFLWLPIVAGALLLLWKLPEIAASYSGRSFTLTERVLTQCVALLDYLRLIILPTRSQLGPYGDGYPIYSSPLEPIVAASAIALLLAIAAAISYRKTAPYVSFAILWFLAGHSMESTVIPLEIYFEHRNYLPAVGIAALIATAPWNVPPKITKLVSAGLLLYITELAFVLMQTTSTWGNPLLAGELWHKEQPHSERAALFLAGEYAKRGNYLTAIRVTDETAKLRPDDIGLSFSALFGACYMDDPALFNTRLDDVLHRLRNHPQDFAAIDTLEKIMRVRKERCPWLNNNLISTFTHAMQANPQIYGNRFVAARLHTINADIAFDERDFHAYVTELERAFLADPQISSGGKLVAAFAKESLWDTALEKLALVEAHIPEHRLQKRLWERNISEMRDYISNRTAWEMHSPEKP